MCRHLVYEKVTIYVDKVATYHNMCPVAPSSV